MQSTLNSLRDVEGVLGSFVVDAQGGVLARDMPTVVDDYALGGAARRVARLRAALETGGRKAEQCSLRFGGYLLLARPADAVTLCVLVSAQANMMALTMGTTLVARRVSAEAGEITRRMRPVAPSLPPPAPVPVARVEEPEPPQATRIFRGRPV